MEKEGAVSDFNPNGFFGLALDDESVKARFLEIVTEVTAAVGGSGNAGLGDSVERLKRLELGAPVPVRGPVVMTIMFSAPRDLPYR